MRGYQQGRFSFNVKGGRCEACSGDGTIKIEMNFLPDVYVPCEVCHGARYNRETLEVHYKGKTIAEVLDMPIEEAVDFFAAIPAIARHLTTLRRGRARLRPARAAGHHAVRRRGPAGQAVRRAAEAVDRPHRLRPRRADHRPALRGHPQAAAACSAGWSTRATRVLVIEHNLDVIKTADWLDRHGPRGRQPRRHGGRRGHARGGRRRPGQLHRGVPGAAARRHATGPGLRPEPAGPTTHRHPRGPHSETSGAPTSVEVVTDPLLSRRRALTGAAAGGLALPILSACGGGGAAGGTTNGGKSSSSGGLVARADVPLGGGVILGDQNVVVTQPSKGTFEGFCGDLHAPGLHPGQRGRWHDQLRLSRQPVLDHRRKQRRRSERLPGRLGRAPAQGRGQGQGRRDRAGLNQHRSTSAIG